MRTVLALLAIASLAMLSFSALAAPALSSPKVTPATGTSDDLYTFTVHYAGEQPASVQLFINGVGNDMLEVDTADTNTTDGKDYYVRVGLDEGVSIFYFMATMSSGEEDRTTASTISVRPPSGIRLDHLDVVFAVLVFLIPVLWALLIFRHISKDIKQIKNFLKDNNKESE
jgi:hypothetical protein